MVQVNKLNKGKAATPATFGAPAKSGTEKQTITKADVGTVPAALTQSTPAASSQAIAKAAKGAIIPAFLKTDTRLPAIIPGGESNYVGFADKRNKIFSQLQANGIEEGNPDLCINSSYIECTPLNYFLYIGESFKSIMIGEAGDWIYATRDIQAPTEQLWEMVNPALKTQQKVGPTIRPAYLPNVDFFKKNLQEHYVLLMLVLLDDGTLVPTKGDFRGTKKGAAEGPIRAVEAASSSDWLDKSDAHRVTGQFPDPFGRVLHSVNTYFKTGKASGNAFYVAEAASNPPSIELMEKLLDNMKDENFNSQLESAHIAYTKRCDFLDQLITESNVG